MRRQPFNRLGFRNRGASRHPGDNQCLGDARQGVFRPPQMPQRGSGPAERTYPRGDIEGNPL